MAESLSDPDPHHGFSAGPEQPVRSCTTQQSVQLLCQKPSSVTAEALRANRW